MIKKIFIIIFALISMASFAQLKVVGADEGIELLPDIPEGDPDEKLEAIEKKVIHPELALIGVQSQIGQAVLKKRLEDNNREIFTTNSEDLKDMVDEFSRYAVVVESLSHLFLENSIAEGATPITPENEEDCKIAEGKQQGSCHGDVYQAQERLAPVLPENQAIGSMREIHAGVSSIVSEGDGRLPALPKEGEAQEQRNIVILTMKQDFKEKREHLEGLIANGLINEISLEGIAFAKENFRDYTKVMGDYLKRVSEVSNLGTCDIPAGSLEVLCFGTRYALTNSDPIGESFSSDLAIVESSRATRESDTAQEDSPTTSGATRE